MDTKPYEKELHVADVTITPLANGPYYISGAVKLSDPNGKEISVEGEKLALCRCGSSSNKPFCDGTHQKIGFNTES